MAFITCQFCGDTYPDFDVAHVCSKGPYAPKIVHETNTDNPIDFPKLEGNQRLIELAEQAGAENLGADLYGGAFIGAIRLDFLEKFAKLIVRECVQTLIDNAPERYTNEAAEEDWDKGYDRAMTDCVHHIKEHFGVEE